MKRVTRIGWIQRAQQIDLYWELPEFPPRMGPRKEGPDLFLLWRVVVLEPCAGVRNTNGTEMGQGSSSRNQCGTYGRTQYYHSCNFLVHSRRATYKSYEVVDISAAGFEPYDRFVLKKVVLYAFFIIKNGVKNVL
jgi:hypothetical protein